MTSAEIERRYRRFLLVLAGVLFVGTAVELVLTEHYASLIQVLPFALCALGLMAVLVLLYAPKRSTVRALRGGMGVVALGSLFGIYEHVAENWAFAREIRPAAAVGDLAWSALSGGNPLLAPGILLLAATLALAATYHHPALEPQPSLRAPHA